MLLDISVKDQQNYIEDCEVCCNPIELKIVFDQGALINFEAKNLGQ